MVTTKEQFAQAVATSRLLKEKPDSNNLLRMYSLYKQATVGNAPEKGDYAMFDFVAKAKHEAWLSLKDMDADAAMNQYISMISELNG